MLTWKTVPVAMFLVGLGGCAGLAVWTLAGCPSGYLECAVASGIATGAVFVAGAIWKIRAAVRYAWLGDEDTPEDRPWTKLPPATLAERREDILALEEGTLLLEEFIDRWSGREREERRAESPTEEPVSGVTPYHDAQQLADVSAASELHTIKERMKAAVDAEINRAEAEPTGTPCANCLGIHQQGAPACTVDKNMWEVGRKMGRAFLDALAMPIDLDRIAEADGSLQRTGIEYVVGNGGAQKPPAPPCTGADPVSGESPFAEADVAIAKSKFKPGQWVRVKPGGMHHHMLVMLKYVQYLAKMLVWRFTSDEGPDSLAEVCFEFAYPMKDEVWEDVYCAKHSPAAKSAPPHVFVVDEDWKDGCLGTPYIRCGCIRPVNFGHGVSALPRTGVEYLAGSPPAKFIIGDKVRVGTGWFEGRIFTLEKLEDVVDRVWLCQFGGAYESIREDRLSIAFPKKGEVWHYKTPCEPCAAKFGPVVPQTPFDIHEDWEKENSWMTRERLRCGCLYRIGTQG